MFQVKLADLNLTSDCSSSTTFILSLSNSDIAFRNTDTISYSSPRYSSHEVAFWRCFLTPLNAKLVRLASLEDIGAAPIIEIGDVDVFNLLHNVAAFFEFFSQFYDFIDATIIKRHLNLFCQPESVKVTVFSYSPYNLVACNSDVLQHYFFQVKEYFLTIDLI
jgi:hypothetical protein